MKSILLATTALVAFAGAAAADGHTSITFSGNTEIGFNDSDPSDNALFIDGDPLAGDNPDFNDDEQGFYWNTDIDVTMSATLDNGLTASTSFEIDIVGDPNNSATLSSDEWVASLESENAGIFIGDTSFAAETHWVSAGDMEGDSFSEADGESAIRGDVNIGPVSASVSYVLTDADADPVSIDEGTDTFNAYDDDVDQLSFGMSAEFGVVTIAAAYQEESVADGDADDTADPEDYDPSDENGDFNTDEVFGISVAGTFAGATVTVAYAEETNADEQSTGVKIAYPFGPVTATAYYVSEDGAGDPEDNYGLNVAYADGPIAVTADYQDDQGTEKWSLEGSYDVGNGLSVFAGVLNDNEGDEDYYVAATYDLGGGAELLVSYAEDDDNDNEDEIGADDYQNGTTIELSFAF
ncbi:porin [Yoonia sp. R2-816]|uniref:porin n=1 Tax=Yoonia sp. R2-816 TaxID=3342638 RepID=UPI0037274E28